MVANAAAGPVKLITQVGFGGGGQQPYPVKGTITISITTASICTWSVKALK